MPKTASVEEWFETLEPGVAPIAEALRAAIEAEGPALTCQLAWGFPCWRGNERIMSIGAQSERCNLQLFYGARLSERWPDRIEGTGKQMRHVKVASPEAVDAELRAIIAAAIAADATDPERVR